MYRLTQKLILMLCTALLLSSACSATPQPSPATQPSPTVSATPVLITATAAPPATPTPAATFAGQPPAQVTPVTTPGSGWNTYSANGVAFLAPANWLEQQPGLLAGPDGYAEISSQPADGAAPGAACLGEANRDKPNRFGRYPEIRDTYQDGVLNGCLILPSPDQPAEQRNAALLLRWSTSERVQVQADRAHIEALAASLQFESAPPAATTCDTTIQNQAPRTITSGGLTITEFAAAAVPAGAACSPLANPPAFYQLATSGAAAKATARILNEQFSNQRIARLNQQLQPFGVRVRVVERRFVIEQNGIKRHANLSWIGPLTIQDTGGGEAADFRLPVVDGYDNGNFILSPTGLQRQEGWDILLFDRVFPIFSGGDLISLAYDYTIYPRQVNNPALLNILKNGQVIDTWSVSGSTQDGGPVRGLWAWQNHWMIELPGLVLEDGQSLNERLNVSETFTWRLINQRPFYFFRQDGQARISYDGQVLEPLYDEVLYQPLSGSAILLEMKTFEKGLFFFARRGDNWYYVTIES